MKTACRVAVGLSGGVDSAVAAALLVDAGFRVFGLTMKIWSGAIAIREEGRHACFGPGEEEDVEACRRICARLGIEYHVVDLCAEYEARVLDYFRSEYRAGRTPNPCVVCNRELKFGFLLKRARESGLEFDSFATGHYARIVRVDGVHYLARAREESKDQTYFLHGLDSESLASIMFPLGDLGKDEVRAIARERGFEVADKPESQDFVAGGDYAPLFADRVPEPGDIVTRDGTVVGRHRGLPFYTIGQRRGIGVSLGPDPVYVLSLDAERNQIVVGPGEGLFADRFAVREFRFQAGPARAGESVRGFVRIRQNHRPVGCSVTTTEPGSAIVEFDVAQRAVAPGQAAVLYSGDGRVLGGGTIASA